ncbi:hypothetical protein CEQ21_06655 [Niallia circulans]|uniref:Uncharacterized protein n=1 Tax=Niallia circulans TaxID=1397 RepID=A0A553SUC5_NIACI|nr:hypothetical protein [Niallia circulans]TRZ40576.1 hypothetical protein CEQ21_06655 [Niallia circulans]
MSNLKSLRKSMSNSILQQGKMSITDKEELYKAVLLHRKARKGFSFAPVLSIAAITCFVVFFGGYIINQTGNSGNQHNQVIPIDNEKEEQNNQQFPNLASFLYELNVKLQEKNNLHVKETDYAKQVGEFAEYYSNQFSSTSKETALIDGLIEIGKWSKYLQQADNDDKRSEIMTELDDVVEQLIMIAENYGIEDERNNIIEKLEFANMEDWLISLKESIHSESYKPYADRGDFEQNIGYAASAYAKHYAALEKNPSTKQQLEKAAEVAEQIEKERDEEQRSELLNKLDLMADRLLRDKY